MRTLQETLKNATHIKVRDFQRYSFGNYEECLSLFIEAFKLVDKTVDEYRHLPEYDEIIKWMSDTQGKGLFLIGNCGRGKSIIIAGVLPLIFNAKKGKILKPIPARKLHKITEYPSPFIVIDDIGTEEIINDYGTKIDAVENAIFEAEDDLKLLLLTSNLDAKAIKHRYGERIYDRIKRLCLVVFMKGGSLRK